jgi:hypothetical protein
MVNSMFGGEITPSPGPGLFGIVQDPLGALGELVFGHPQAGRSIHHFHDLHVIFVGKKPVGCREIGGFTSDLEKNWAQSVA